MSCGAVQTMLKSSSLVPEGRVMVVGLGPLLLLIAQQLARAGVDIAAVLETAPLGNYAAAVARLPQALMAPGYVAKGRAILAELGDRGVALRRGVSGVRLTGDDQVREIEYRWRGRSRREAVDMVLLHQGVVPNANLGLSLRIDHAWDSVQRCFTPSVDDWGNTSTEGILAAGDCSGIGGALVAEYRGRLAALDAARQLERIGAEERDNRAQPVRRDRDRHMFGAALPRHTLPAATGKSGAARRRHLGMPLRGSQGRRDPQTDDRAELPRSQPDENLRALRHGALSGPDVRPHGG